MAFPFQTVKKLVMFFLLGIAPLIVFLLLLALQVLYGIPLGLPEMVLTSIFVLLIMLVFTYKVTDSPFLKMYEGSAYGVLTIDATGKIDFFNVVYQDGRLVGEFQGKEINEPFSRKFFFYLNSVFGRGTAVEVEETLELKLEKLKYNNALFKTEYPVLIWSKTLKQFITKEYLHGKDNKEMIISLGRSYYAELQAFNASASTITRYIVDLLGKKLLGGQSWLFWILVLFVLGILVWLGWPSIQGFLGQAAGTAGDVAALPEKLA